MTAPTPEGPATETAVKRWLYANEPNVAAEDEIIALATSAANADVQHDHQPDADGRWAANTVLGTVIMAARWVSRRMTPLGVSDGAMGPVYVARRDPDVDRLLGRGSYRKPMVG